MTTEAFFLDSSGNKFDIGTAQDYNRGLSLPLRRYYTAELINEKISADEVQSLNYRPRCFLYCFS